jgi:hypothetical protein
MKKIGLVVSLIGLLITLFAGFSFVTREKVVEIGSLEIMADKHHFLDWSPYLGIAVLTLGVLLYLVGTQKK